MELSSLLSKPFDNIDHSESRVVCSHGKIYGKSSVCGFLSFSAKKILGLSNL